MERATTFDNSELDDQQLYWKAIEKSLILLSQNIIT